MDIDIESNEILKESMRNRKTSYPEVEVFCLLLGQKYFLSKKYYEKVN